MVPFHPFLPGTPYFFLHVHFSDGLLQPTHTPFLIAMPQVLHGSHPQVWHISTSFIPVSSKRKRLIPLVAADEILSPEKHSMAAMRPFDLEGH